MSYPIGDNMVVSIHYQLCDTEGEVLEKTEENEPLEYLHGAENIIPGLEKALAGRVPGDKFRVQIEPEDAYGDIQPDLVQMVDRASFEGIEKIEEGMVLDVESEEGDIHVIEVIKVEDDVITIDANHPLAGEVLVFDIEVVAVRAATGEELAHSHPH